MLDDTPRKLGDQHRNPVPIRPFMGDPADRELQLLMSYLRELKSVGNIRRVEERGWQSRY